MKECVTDDNGQVGVETIYTEAAIALPSPTIERTDERIPVVEQDFDFGKEGVQGLMWNGLGPPVEAQGFSHLG
jgi:hypothetical protein